MRLLNRVLRRSNRRLVAVAAVGWLLSLAVLVPEASSPAMDCSILLAQPESSSLQQPTEDPGRPSPAQRPPANPPTAIASQALRAPQERELTELGGVLKALANDKTAPAMLAGLRAGKPFSFERFGVLVADVRSIVVLLDARELRSRLSRAKEISAETRQGIDQRVRVLEACAPGRFENRGGTTTLGQVTSLVQKHRAQLVPFLFQSVMPPEAPVAAPPTQRKQG